jgi:hypothetical protein
MTLSALGIFSAAGAGGGVAASDFDLLETQILGSNQASITFSSLGTYSSTYKHLQVRWVARANVTAFNRDDFCYRFNGDSGNNYSEHGLSGTGSVVGAGATSSFNRGFCGSLATAEQASGIFSSGVIDILDAYATKNKVVRTLFGRMTTSSPYSVGLQSSMYISTSAITSLELFASSGQNLITGTRMSLYGTKG